MLDGTGSALPLTRESCFCRFQPSRFVFGRFYFTFFLSFLIWHPLSCLLKSIEFPVFEKLLRGDVIAAIPLLPFPLLQNLMCMTYIFMAGSSLLSIASFALVKYYGGSCRLV